MQTYRFGEFELDLEAQQLRLRGEPVHLERRPFGLLVMLVTRAGRVVTRDDIVAALWPSNVVIDFDSGVNTLVRKVRHALGDTADTPRFIETVSGRGYRFVAPVTGPEPAPGPPAGSVASPVVPRRRIAWPVAALVLLVAVVAGYLAWQSFGTGSAATRIAVLPFDNLTGEESLAYLASGLTEETTTSLAQIDLPELSVVGVVSAQAFVREGLSLEAIGEELGVDYVVTSSLRLERPRIRLTSRLLRTADGEQLWTASFDRELTNVLGLQRELAVAIAEQVRQRLSPEVAAALDRRQTQNPEAYEFYLKGRYAWSRFSPSAVEQALGFYRQAVSRDPAYALAWAGIAHALATSPMTIDAEPAAVIPAAREALAMAESHGPDIAEVQQAKATLHFFIDWDWPAAESAGRRAVALDPNSALAHMLLGLVLSEQGRHTEARDLLRRARELDPLFPLMYANSAVVALQAGDPDGAVEFARQAVAMNPEFWVGHLHLGSALRALGDRESALRAYADADRLSAGNSKAVSYRGHTLARLGRDAEARQILARLIGRSEERYLPPVAIAVVYAGLGEDDEALLWLERALLARDVHLIGLTRDTRFEALHGNRRFEALVESAGIAPTDSATD
ncbi:tetratricopeptide repeat protein [Lentisalinibacter salinarum]